MFPQEGETVPKVRFKGFEGEWDFVTAGEVFRTTNVRNRPDLPVLSATHDKGLKEVILDIRYFMINQMKRHISIFYQANLLYI